VGPPAWRLRVLLHPLVIACVIGLIANDRWAKANHPSWLTGKASDAFGAVVLTAILAVIFAYIRGQTIDRRLLLITATVVVLAVTAAKTTSTGTELAGVLLGWFRWPLQLGAALLSGSGSVGPSPVDVVLDPWDALAAAVAFAAVLLVPAGQALTPRVHTGTPDEPMSATIGGGQAARGRALARSRKSRIARL
jgi:hypothetical protein